MSRELLFSITKKDLDIQWFSGTGAGGQHRNKHQNCCRLFHPDSQVRVTGQSHRNREANLKQAFKNLIKHPKFKIWLNNKIKNKDNTSINIHKKVSDMMSPDNLKIEYYENGQWVEQ